ncbi:hypothetical protein IL306_004509 [Fusarium sp. DS 682]|nr:hypothetical protein IL306_004509 [Fusarium sp. DS 682]
MALLRSRFSSANHFTLSIFGCQYHAEAPSPTKLNAIQHFDKLLEDAGIPVERLEQNNIPSRVWMTYWTSPQAFKTWWESDATRSFWESLPDDAGFWRESVCLPATRAMHEVTGEHTVGFGHCGELAPLTEKTGYWGAYRSRMTPDFEGDTFSSPLPDLQTSASMSDKVRHGRIQMTGFPDNLCIVIEGQDYSAMKEKERSYWDENFDQLTKDWVTTVVTSGPDKGMVSARACHAFAGEKSLGTSNGTNTDKDIFPGLDYIRQAQILFWTDISKMEHIGRWDKGHVKLRRNFMTAYGPGGPVQGGDLLLWVDLGIIKGSELDAEYIGCYEGTGFLAFDKSPKFASKNVTAAELPAIFDKPIACQPIEW